MKKQILLTMLFGLLFAVNALAATVNPVSDCPLEYYAQGGIVHNGIGYFTSDPGANVGTGDRDNQFDFVTAFGAETLEKVRTYDFRSTYDSSPYVYQKVDGTWLIAAREKNSGVYRLAARRLGTDALEWAGPANITQDIYYGVSTYYRADGSQILYAPGANGLHAVSGENGAELWSIPESSYGCTTPAVDQANGWVFYQSDGDIYKLQAETGEVLVTHTVAWPNICSSFNTVLVNDSYGYFVVTRWHTSGSANTHYDCGIRVWDQNLNLIWEKTGLPYGKKATITYWDGKMVIGTGNHWGTKYTDAENLTKPWKNLTAYHVTDGSQAWFCDLSDITYTSIFNAPYFNGNIYAEVENSPNSYLVRIRASDGQRMEVYNYGHRVSSCGVAIIAHGRMYSGNLSQDRVVVTKLAENTHQDWPALFYDPQTNIYAAPDDPNAVLVPMHEIGRWSTDLTVTVTGPASPTSLNPIPFAIAFNRPVTNLTAAEIDVTNGTKGTLTGSGAGPYTLPVTPTVEGDVTCKVRDWAVLDDQENGNYASNTCTVTFANDVPPGPEPPEDYSTWAHSIPLRFAGYDGTDTLTSFPLLVRLDSVAFPPADFEAGGADLRFADFDGHPLPYEIEAWNQGGESSIWVAVPQIASSADFIQMYWGKPGATSHARPEGVWTDGFLGVWHLDSTLQDSTAIERDATNNGATTQDALIASGANFDGNDYVSLPANAGGTTAGSLSLWIKTSTNFTSLAHVFYFRGPGGTSNPGSPGDGLGGQNEFHINFLTTDSLNLFIEGGATNNLDVYATTAGPCNDGQWHYVAATWQKPGTCSLYLDGELADSTPHIGTTFDFTQFIALGKPETNNRYFTGQMDEARQSGAVRSADWIRASYLNQRRDSVFIQYGGGSVPTADVTGPALPTRTSPILFTIEFSESVTGLTTAGITVTNGTKDALSGSGAGPYTLTVTPAGQGAVTCQVIADAAQGSGGYGNTASGTVGVTFDSAAPTAIVSGPVSPTQTNPILFRINFGESVTGLTAAGITVTNGAKGALSGNGAGPYTLPVTPAGDGAVTCRVTAGAAQDAAGNGSVASDMVSITFDSEEPTATVSGPPSPTFVSEINFVINFSEPVNGLTEDGIAVTNAAKGTLSGSGAGPYTLPVTADAAGAVTCQVGDGAAQDGAGNGNIESDGLSIIYDPDTTAPMATVTGPVSPTHANPISFAIEFSEPVTGLTVAGIAVTNGAKGALSGSGAGLYTLPVTPAGQGVVTCQVSAEAARDAADNGNTQSDIASVTFDSVVPTATVSGPSSPCSTGPILFTIGFSEPVTSLTAAGIAVTNGTKGALSGGGAGPYTLPVTPVSRGEITCQVTAGAAQDAAANPNTASAAMGVTYVPENTGAKGWNQYDH